MEISLLISRKKENNKILNPSCFLASGRLLSREMRDWRGRLKHSRWKKIKFLLKKILTKYFVFAVTRSILKHSSLNSFFFLPRLSSSNRRTLFDTFYLMLVSQKSVGNGKLYPWLPLSLPLQLVQRYFVSRSRQTTY